jgi:hypothetical protein
VIDDPLKHETKRNETMALPLLPILLLFGAGAGVVAIVAAKNVRGEDVKIGQRSIYVYLMNQDKSVAKVQNLDVFPEGGVWVWVVPDWSDGESPYVAGHGGKAATRKAAFNEGFLQLMSEDDFLTTNVSPASSGLQIDFYNKDSRKAPDELGEDLIFRVSIIPTSGGWLAQITDPSASVKFMNTYPSRNAAISSTYAFVEKAGY